MEAAGPWQGHPDMPMPFRAWVQSLLHKAAAQQHSFADPKITAKLHDEPITLPVDLPPVPDDCVRMALWLYAPNAIDVNAITQGLASPEAWFGQLARKARGFTSKLLQNAFDVTAKPPLYVSFTAEMEPAHTAGLPDRKNTPHAKSCAVLCLVDVSLELPVLEETLATRRRGRRRAPPLPPAFGVYGVLRRPFEDDFYTATADGVVACNYSKDHMCAAASNARASKRMGFKIVPSTQIFLSTELAATHVHPTHVYYYSDTH